MNASTNEKITPIINTLQKYHFTKEKPYVIFDNAVNFNFALFENIQILNEKCKPSDLIIHVTRRTMTGASDTNEIKLASYESKFVKRGKYDVLQTSEISFFKDANNFSVKARSLEISIEHINSKDLQYFSKKGYTTILPYKSLIR